MRCAGGLYECIIKLLHCIGEEFSGLGTAHFGTGGRPTKDGADNAPDGFRIDPALLQNLARQLFDAFSDRLVFDHGTCGVGRGCSRLRHVMLLSCCWSTAYRVLCGPDSVNARHNPITFSKGERCALQQSLPPIGSYGSSTAEGVEATRPCMSASPRKRPSFIKNPIRRFVPKA